MAVALTTKAASGRLDDDHRYAAIKAKDARFDGCFFTAVTSTGIYCRPSCPAITPRRDRVRFFPTAAAAQRAGFRACKRCRPDASPGSPEWNLRGDVVGRAMRSIHDGVVDREGVAGLARRLNYSPRQLHRLLVSEVGAGPLELARAQRADTARVLLETTDLRAGEVAFGAGFGSIRQFNDTVMAVFGESPRALRARAGRRSYPLSGRQAGEPVSLSLRLAYRPPFPAGALFGFLATRAVPGVEEGDGSFYRRALRLPHGGGVVTVRAGQAGTLTASFQLDDLRDLTLAVRRLRQMFDLDSEPDAVAAVLAADAFLAPAVSACPGLRVPGHVDGDEMAVRAVLGQQVSVAGARTLAARLAEEHGEPLRRPTGTIERLFPSSEVLAGLDPADLPMPTSRARGLIRLCELLASGELALDPGADRDDVSAKLLSVPGVGPWTVAYLRMRALGDPDAFLPSDLGVRKALERLGLPSGERQALEHAERWRPYRAYALQYLWSGLPGGANNLQSEQEQLR
ncbi:MAG TPA: AlkA N-terminal domain-containing protein [Acidimicrobiales bacterium]|jgi:AraC family transcriptional regulator of adaptative response / DNA-3-methyladenine glycosylase II|nr:AlkA N-terminal domain-containing protein [Acidimicrobiales bacterium]